MLIKSRSYITPDHTTGCQIHPPGTRLPDRSIPPPLSHLSHPGVLRIAWSTTTSQEMTMESTSYPTVANCDSCKRTQVEGTMHEHNGSQVLFVCTLCGQSPSGDPATDNLGENSPPPDRSDVLDYL